MPRAAPSPRPRHGERQRRRILAAAVDLASSEGLSGLSIGRLADATGMSKSGLFAHFGAKQELQIAAIDAAAAEFEAAVAQPALDEEPGLARLHALLDRWLSYVEHIEYRGGCFFFATSSEYGSRPGPIREHLARFTRAWLRALEREARVALRQGELAPGCDPCQLAFELHAFVQEANWTREIFADAAAFRRAQTAIAQTLRRAARDPRAGRRASRKGVPK